MASLRNIMNVDVDDDHASSGPLKNPPDATSRSSEHSDPSTASGAHTRRTSYTISSSPSRDQTFNPSSRSSHSLSTDQVPSGLPFTSQPVHDHSSDRRQSNTSTDSMDSHYSHGYAHGHPTPFTTHSPMRPFVSPQEATVKLTPITGRVSRAKKGVPVHTCEQCQPPKTFTRAEHLRRHQLSHQPADLPCPVPNCGKRFHRRDLLERHQQRHDQEHHGGKSSAGVASRPSPNRGGGRKSSYKSSPPASLMPISQYGSASPKPAAPAVSMSPGHWRSPESTLPMQHANNDIIMEGVKGEYLVEPAPAHLQSASPDARQPRSERICPPPTATIAATSWATAPVMTTPATQACFPAAVLTPDRREAGSFCSLTWAPTNPIATRTLPGTVLAADSGFDASYEYDAPLPPSYSSVYEQDPAAARVTSYDDSPSLYGSHIPVPAMRSLSPQLLVGQSSETMIATAVPLPANRVMTYREESSPRLDLLSQDLMPLSQETRSALPNYIGVFWRDVHPLYPIIHRSTVENGSNTESGQVDMLRCAMAAVATQFLPHEMHRINGSQLHAYASQVSNNFTQTATWSLPTMQTVLLCEYYARFRGRQNDDYQPSVRFFALYQMVSAYRTAAIPETSPSNPQRWSSWVYTESCKRLLSACFLLSVHGMCYFELPYDTVLDLEDGAMAKLEIPLSAGTSALWQATNADAWAAIDPSTVHQTLVADVMDDASWPAKENPDFDVSLVIAAHARRLPQRQMRHEIEVAEGISAVGTDELLMSKHFSHWPGAAVYLALYHTPLHVLLAVSGETWLFNKKIPDAKLFAEYKIKLAQWRDSSTSAAAAIFAARAIRGFLRLSADAEDETAEACVTPTNGVAACKDISDYWGLYVCTLICWAFGHVDKRVAAGATKKTPSRKRALSWISKTANSVVDQGDSFRSREDSSAVVALVLEQLEKDCLGRRNILLDDAAGVLRKLEVDNWNWF